VFSTRFARAVPQGIVYAIDVEPKQLDRLREDLIAQNIDNVVPVLASYRRPICRPSCDVVFIGDTYHHIENRVDYMRRLRARSSRAADWRFEYKPGTLPVGPPADHKPQAG
jgi:precorrin-6B methylase 2